MIIHIMHYNINVIFSIKIEAIILGKYSHLLLKTYFLGPDKYSRYLRLNKIYYETI